MLPNGDTLIRWEVVTRELGMGQCWVRVGEGLGCNSIPRVMQWWTAVHVIWSCDVEG